ncbi:MAG TPA: hypothetical protein VF331_12910 [Polyangiales bacterium]
MRNAVVFSLGLACEIVIVLAGCGNGVGSPIRAAAVGVSGALDASVDAQLPHASSTDAQVPVGAHCAPTQPWPAAEAAAEGQLIDLINRQRMQSGAQGAGQPGPGGLGPCGGTLASARLHALAASTP